MEGFERYNNIPEHDTFPTFEGAEVNVDSAERLMSELEEKRSQGLVTKEDIKTALEMRESLRTELESIPEARETLSGLILRYSMLIDTLNETKSH